jgi:CDP-diacylglycerol pyrophosphatase
MRPAERWFKLFNAALAQSPYRSTRLLWSDVMSVRTFVAWVALWALGVTAMAALGAQPAFADRSLLWNVVNFKCLTHLTKSEAPIPCDSVDVSAGWDHGVALLKDFDGTAGMLVVPTHRVTGTDDAALLTPDEPNYFASAWAARMAVARRLRTDLPREAIAITVDSVAASNQDQLYLRTDCVDKDVAASLASYSNSLDTQWRAMTIDLKGRRYWARKLESNDLSDFSPFQLLAEGINGARTEMGLWSLAAVGANFSDTPGFILLADHAEPSSGGHAEDLQDRQCAIAKSKS